MEKGADVEGRRHGWRLAVTVRPVAGTATCEKTPVRDWTPALLPATFPGLRLVRPRDPSTRGVMIEIQIGEGDRIEWALKQFRRKMLRSGLFKDMKKKRFYEKPSEARKRKAADARRRNARARRRR